jgi:hypothetical protein
VSIKNARSRAIEAKNARRDAGGPPTESGEDARRALTQAKIQDFIERNLAQAPALTDEQRTLLAALLSRDDTDIRRDPAAEPASGDTLGAPEDEPPTPPGQQDGLGTDDSDADNHLGPGTDRRW